MQKKIKVLHIIPSIIKGGAEKMVVDLANISVKKNCKINLLIGNKSNEILLSNKIHTKIKTKYIFSKSVNKFKLYFFSLIWVFKNFKWILRHDIIHLHLTYSGVLGSFIYLLKYFNNREKTFIVETYHAVGMKISPLKRFFHRMNFKLRNSIVFVAKDQYWNNFIKKNNLIKNIHIIPNGISNPKKLSQKRIQKYLSKIGMPKYVDTIIGNIGQFRPDRNPIKIASIFISVLKKSPKNIGAVMCGSGSELKKIRQLVKLNKLSDRFILPGEIENPQLIIPSISIYLAINVGSITGIAAIEAAFNRIPILALQFDKKFKLIDNWIWSSPSLDSIHKKIIYYLQNQRKLKFIAKNQYNFVIKNLSDKLMYDKHFKLYKNLLKSK